MLSAGSVVELPKHTTLISREGTERAIADSGAPIRDEKGALRGVVLVFHDQTEQRRAERALAVLLADLEDRVSPVRRQFEERLSCPSDARCDKLNCQRSGECCWYPVFIGKPLDSGQPLNGDIAEIVGVRGRMSDAEIDALEAYLAEKYDL